MTAPFIVAELSASHCGDEERALHIIDAAARAGADGVKFQTWRKDSMVGPTGYTIPSGPWAGQKLADLYAEAYLPWEWHQTLYAAVRSHGMIPFSSVFDRESVDFLETLDCPIYKISSFEITDLELIHHAASTGKPIVISTGMATHAEITAAKRVAVHAGCSDLTILACTSAYPTPLEEADLTLFSQHQDLPKAKLGLSDHTKSHQLSVMATTLGATMIEKHLNLEDARGPDGGFAMTPADFQEMARRCRQAAQIMGNKKNRDIESSSQDLRRSLWWAKSAKAGETITRDMLISARPFGGLSPAQLPNVLGGILKHDITAESAVCLTDIRATANLRARTRQRANGKFQAIVQDPSGTNVWSCDHDHTYGTHNSPYKDSASKCGNAKIKEMRAA